MNRGFIQIRRGLEEHLVNGNIGAFEAGVYLVIHMQADYRTGVWTGSAPRLLATLPRGATLRKVQHALRRLTAIRFIRSFRTHGVRGNYRVLIDKFEPQSPALKGKRLSAWESESWKKPHYKPCTDADTDTVTDAVTDAAPYQEGLKGRRIHLLPSRTEKTHTPAIETLRHVFVGLPKSCRCDSRQFHDAFENALRALGWSVAREYPVADRGNGSPGAIDLVVTSPERIAIELDRLTPRRNSISKLSRFDGLGVVVLREQADDQAIVDVTNYRANESGPHRSSYERFKNKAPGPNRAEQRRERNKEAIRTAR